MSTIQQEIKNVLEEKINDVFLQFQNKLNISNGDISPWDAVKLDTQMDALTLTIMDVLNNQMEG